MSTWQGNILRGTRAAQPAATAVVVGATYFVTDEGVTERSTGAAWESYSATTVGGNVVGPASSTDNAVARFDGTTGKLLQNTSALTLSDTGVFTFPDNLRQTFNPGADQAGLNVGSVAADPATPSNGDAWYQSTANELRARINGVTVALGGSGTVVQIVQAQSGTSASGTTQIPLDTTIPQNTEGDEYITLAVTPTDATNRLRIEAMLFATTSTASRWITAALFQDTTASAIAANLTWQTTAGGGGIVTLNHDMVAGTTSATTFKIRMGMNGSGTLTFNTTTYGGVVISSITITEYVP